MFVFFGPVAVLGTVITQGAAPGALAVVAALAVGMLTCAVLVANNLRDIPTDEAVGKRTLAVLLGDTDTRRLYAALVTRAAVVLRAGRAAELAAAARPGRRAAGGAAGPPGARRRRAARADPRCWPGPGCCCWSGQRSPRSGSGSGLLLGRPLV